MESDHQNPETKQDNANYETLGEPETILVGKQGFIEVAHLCDASPLDSRSLYGGALV